MKKVLIAIGGLSGGGAERQASLWTNALQEHGYEVSLLVYARSEREYPIHPDIKIYTVAGENSDITALSYAQRFRRMRMNIKQAQPDVLISFLPRMQVWMMLTCFGLGIHRIDTIRMNPWMTYPHFSPTVLVCVDI